MQSADNRLEIWDWDSVGDHDQKSRSRGARQGQVGRGAGPVAHGTLRRSRAAWPASAADSIAWRLELEKTDGGEFWKTIKRNNDSFAAVPGLDLSTLGFFTCMYICMCCVYGVGSLGSGGQAACPSCPLQGRPCIEGISEQLQSLNSKFREREEEMGARLPPPNSRGLTPLDCCRLCSRSRLIPPV
jgi:hypothetical protein